jgi:hypothetical protein
MSRIWGLLTVAVVLTLAGSVTAQEKVDLSWKLAKDKPFFQEMKTTTTQNMKVMGLDVNQTQEQTFYFTWKPLEEKDGKWTLEQTIDAVKMKITIAGNTIEFDSTVPGTQTNALSEFFKQLIGSKFKLTIDKDKRVSAIDAGDFVKKLSQANQQMAPLLDKILSESALKQMADPTFGISPIDPVAKGESWSKDSELNLGPIGSYKTTFKYTYEGKEKAGEKELDKIKVEPTLTYAVPQGGSEGLPFRITKADLKSGKDSTGTILFDGKAGRLESSNLTLQLQGELTIDIGGNSTKVELKQEQKTELKTLDKNPLEEKK